MGVALDFARSVKVVELPELLNITMGKRMRASFSRVST